VRITKKRGLALAAACGAAGAVALAAVASGSTPSLTSVPNAQPRAAGLTTPNVLSPELADRVAAQGSMPVENPADLVQNAAISVTPPTSPPVKVTHYGYDGVPPSTMLPALGSVVEAQKTEPDKNTYLVVKGQTGPDAKYDYGTHFVFQGHEAGPGSAGYVTRINLDADAAHKVTLFASQDKDGKGLPVFDGSTWDPFAKQLLFTAERGPATGGVWQSTLDFPPKVEDISGVLGRGGMEGIQADSDGNLWIVEDVGGTTVNNARRPNSFVYRFIPTDPSDLAKGGKLQALQVISNETGKPIVFDPSQSAQDAINSADVKDLHTYGQSFDTGWVTVHDTAVNGFTPFDANGLAKTAGATPFKRPENGMFRPTSKFREFFFTETGDTNLTSPANADFGGFGALFKLTQPGPSADAGTLSLFFRSDRDHTGLDNLAFVTKTGLAAVEDAGATVHTQRNGLDSAFLFDAQADYGAPSAPPPTRFIAEGRDPSATLDAGLVGQPGFVNEDDNEITGIHVSDGDPTVNGLLGVHAPNPLGNGDGNVWRIFWTQQHGDNVTHEIVPGG
jgi:hypothetical protein